MSQTALELPGLPAALEWDLSPHSATLEAGALNLVAGPNTDLFSDPAGAPPKADSPRLLFAPQGDFTLAAHVQVDFRSTFDAGVLLIWVDADHHAKLCFEYSPQGQPMIVSVVTNGLSDDCNSVVVEGNQTWLRIMRRGDVLALQWSADGSSWHFVRYFTLRKLDGLRAGFSSQSPTGQGCSATFSRITYRPSGVEDVRSGE